MRTRFGLKVAPGIKTAENYTNIPASIRTLYNFKTSKHRSVTCQHRSVNLHFSRHRSVIFRVTKEFLFLVNFQNTDLQGLHRSDKFHIDLKSSKKITQICNFPISQREHVFSIIPAEISLMGRNCQNEICWSKNWISASKT